MRVEEAQHFHIARKSLASDDCHAYYKNGYHPGEKPGGEPPLATKYENRDERKDELRLAKCHRQRESRDVRTSLQQCTKRYYIQQQNERRDLALRQCDCDRK